MCLRLPSSGYQRVEPSACKKKKETPMATSRLRDICFDCADHHRVAHFWAAVLGYTIRPADPEATPDDSIALDPPEAGIFGE